MVVVVVVVVEVELEVESLVILSPHELLTNYAFECHVHNKFDSRPLLAY